MRRLTPFFFFFFFGENMRKEKMGEKRQGCFYLVGEKWNEG